MSIRNTAQHGETVAVGVPFSRKSTGIYVGVSGNVTCEFADGDTLEFVGLAAGVIHPIECMEVTAAAATSIIAVFDLKATSDGGP